MRHSPVCSSCFDRGDLLDAVHVAAALERRREPHAQDLLGEPEGDDAGADRQDVGVVVRPAEPGGEEIVAERGAHPVHLVRRDLLALAAAAEHDPPVGGARGDLAAHGRAVLRVVDRGLRIGPEIDDVVPLGLQHADEVGLQREPGMVGAESDPHRSILTRSLLRLHVRRSTRASP